MPCTGQEAWRYQPTQFGSRSMVFNSSQVWPQPACWRLTYPPWSSRQAGSSSPVPTYLVASRAPLAPSPFSFLWRPKGTTEAVSRLTAARRRVNTDLRPLVQRSTKTMTMVTMMMTTMMGMIPTTMMTMMMMVTMMMTMVMMMMMKR